MNNKEVLKALDGIKDQLYYLITLDIPDTLCQHCGTEVPANKIYKPYEIGHNILDIVKDLMASLDDPIIQKIGDLPDGSIIWSGYNILGVKGTTLPKKYYDSSYTKVLNNPLDFEIVPKI